MVETDSADANAEQPESEPEEPEEPGEPQPEAETELEEPEEPAAAALPVDDDVAAAAAADSPAFVEPRPVEEFRELLASVETPADLADLSSGEREDVERALKAQASRDAGEAARRWEGATARLPDGEVVEVVEVVDVHTPDPADVVAGEPVAVDVETTDGRRETTSVADLAPAGPALIREDAGPAQAAELLAVLDEGIAAVETDGERAAFARSLRESVADQHRRLR